MQLHNLTLLVADSAAPMRNALAHQLEAFGYGSVLQARDSLRAQQLLQAQPVDLVISDMSEDTGGLNLLQWLRESPRHRQVPVMLTAGELDRASAQRAITMGINDLLIKPFTTKRLIERAMKILDKEVHGASTAVTATGGPAAAAPAAAIATDAPERATVLVVDDTPENLQLLAGLFRDRYKVKLAPNGEKALSICQSDAPPDLILLDVMMPGMDGFEVAQRVRQHHAGSHTPIIFVTAMTDEASRRKGLALGAIDYVAKPIDPELLQLRVNNLMQYVEHRRQMQTDFDRLRELDALRQEVAQLRARLASG